MRSDRSLPIIDPTYRLVLEVDRAVGKLPRSERPGLARRAHSAANRTPIPEQAQRAQRDAAALLALQQGSRIGNERGDRDATV